MSDFPDTSQAARFSSVDGLASAKYVRDLRFLLSIALDCSKDSPDSTI